MNCFEVWIPRERDKKARLNLLKMIFSSEQNIGETVEKTVLAI